MEYPSKLNLWYREDFSFANNLLNYMDGWFFEAGDRKASWLFTRADTDISFFLGYSCLWVAKHSGQDKSGNSHFAFNLLFSNNAFSY